MDLDRLLKFMTDKGASDLHLKPTRPPLLRITGRLMPLESEPLKPEDLNEMLQAILTPRQKAKLEEKLSVDIGYGVRGLARFRGNIYMQRGTIAASFRRIPYQIEQAKLVQPGFVALLPARGAAIAALIGCDHVKARLGQRQHHLAPAVGQLRKTVQQQHARAPRCIEAGFEHVHGQAVAVVDLARADARGQQDGGEIGDGHEDFRGFGGFGVRDSTRGVSAGISGGRWPVCIHSS